MKNILIIQFISSAVNYIDDAINRGHQPVIFYKKPDKNNPLYADVGTYNNVLKYKNKIKAYEIDDNYQNTLKLAKKIKPVAVLHCTDAMTSLVNRLNSDLGLPSNPLKYVNCYYEKFPMQDALKKYGIRYIRSKVIRSVEEGVEFFENEQLKECVIKQSSGAASVGLHMCDDKDSLVKFLKEEFNNTYLFTGEQCNEMLIQEKINGTEYVVNTMSNNGDHNLLSFWRYNKKPAINNSYVYDYVTNMYKLEGGSYKLLKYAYSVLDAVHFKNGPVHGEYMVDENGPVLIEINCRTMGGNMPPAFLDAAHGHHETDVVLNDLLSPGYHSFYKELPYYPLAKATLKVFISQADAKLLSIPGNNLLKHLKSFFSVDHHVKTNMKIKPTVDLFSSPGSLYLVNTNETQLNKDLDLVSRLEKNDPELIYQTKKPNLKNKPKNTTSLNAVLKKFCLYGSTIIFSNNDKLKSDKFIVNEKTVKKVKSGFVNAVFDYNYTEKFTLPNYIDAFFDFVSCIKNGGQILVPESSY